MRCNNIKKLISNYECPTYVFDINELARRAQYLKTVFQDRALLCYAMKANPLITNYVDKFVQRLEVCSPGELQICINKNIKPEKIVVSGVYKDDNTILNLASKDSIFTIESLNQYDLIKTKAIRENSKIKVLLRLTSNNQFGLDKDDIIKVINDNKINDLVDILGIQFYSQTQKESIHKIEKELQLLDALIIELQTEQNFTVLELEYGLGLPVNYFTEVEFDEAMLLSNIKSLISNMNFKGQLVIELGRGLVASCGKYITKVVDLKNNYNQSYAIVDGGIHHISYYGQFMATKIPNIDVYPDINLDKKEYVVCGSLCTVNDVLVRRFNTRELRLGDYLVFNLAGAYSMCEGISLLLSRNLPKVVVIVDNEIKTIREEVKTYLINS